MRANNEEGALYAEKITQQADAVQERLSTLLTARRERFAASALKKADEFKKPVPEEPVPDILPRQPHRTDKKYNPDMPFFALFSGKKQREFEQQQTSVYQFDLAKWEQDTMLIRLSNDKKIREYEAACRQWEEEKNAFYEDQDRYNKEIDDLFTSFYTGSKNKDTIERLCLLILQQFTLPIDYDDGIEVQYKSDEGLLIIDMLMPALDNYPGLKKVIFVKSTQSFKESYYPETYIKKQYNKMIYDMVLYILDSVFIQDTPEFIKAIVLNGRTQTIDRTIGREVVPYILSVKTTREDFCILDFEHIDSKEWFKKSKGRAAASFASLTPIVPIRTFDTNDPEVTENGEVLNGKDEKVEYTPIDWADIENELINIRHELHEIPERSGKEIKTEKWIRRYLMSHTTLEVRKYGNGLCAIKRVDGSDKGTIAFRADYDAVALPNGRAAHLCGHDGHAASLLGLALYLETHPADRTVLLLFQPAEETGQGAAQMAPILKAENVTEVYGCHNLPGLPLGQVYTTKNAFACASCGLIISFVGKAAHAAYPENGISPAGATADILQAVRKLNEENTFGDGSICTVIGISMGQKAFGTAAEKAELWFTLRARTEEQFESIKTYVKDTAKTSADRDGLRCDIDETEVFPATVNNIDCVMKVLIADHAQLLEEPMRWSEDFGYYLREIPGAFFGIGAGEGTAALHTKSYEYPDQLLIKQMESFIKLL